MIYLFGKYKDKIIIYLCSSLYHSTSPYTMSNPKINIVIDCKNTGTPTEFYSKSLN